MTRDIVPKLLPSVAGHYFLRHIELPAVSAEWPDMPMPLPMGEVALRSNDGEGKPVSREPRYSDKQALRQSDAIAAPARPRQRPCPLSLAPLASSPSRGASGEEVGLSGMPMPLPMGEPFSPPTLRERP